MTTYEFIDKALFFPEKGILVIGDLHIGYDYMLKQSGILVPERQIDEILSNLDRIIKEVKKRKGNINKIIFLGDLKHSFGFEFEERDELKKVLNFLGKEVPGKDIIFVKGNHDTMDYTPKKTMKQFHTEDEIFFAHGHENFLEMFDKKIKTVVSGHLHPSVLIAEKEGVKKETFKCFLEGTHKGKTFIVLPSFLGFIEGTNVNDYKEDFWESFSIIPKKDMMKFKVRAIGKDDVFDFGRVKDL
ncbi:MAG: metallophosphoesterase [Nanoarchaeota archaeon]|nr:metallophosphoesterase [Nanoarchaeota archaeon]